MQWFLILWAKIQQVSKSVKVNIIDNVISHNPFAALSANMGRYLNGRINNLQDGALFLSAWNCITGLPEDDPRELPYDYKKGMFFIVSETSENMHKKKIKMEYEKLLAELIDKKRKKKKPITEEDKQILQAKAEANVGEFNGTNYRPSGTRYEPSSPSTVVETEPVNIGDKYWFSGTSWLLIQNQSGEIAWPNIAGDDPYQNEALAAALNDKVPIDTTSTTYAKVYAKDKNGTQNNLIVTRDAYANSVVQRDGNNRFAVNDPANGTDVCNKQYADKMLNMSGSGTYQGSTLILRATDFDDNVTDIPVVIRSN